MRSWMLRGERSDVPRIASNRAHIHHAPAELDKRAAHNRQVKLRDVRQDKFDQLLVLLLAEPVDERLARQLLGHAVRRQAVLGKPVIEVLQNCISFARTVLRAGQLQLLADLVEITAPHEARRGVVAQLLEHIEHLGRHRLPCWRQRAVDIKQANDTRVLALRQRKHHDG